MHFHDENVDSIDDAISVYTEDIVWEVPARGLVLRNVEDEEWVFDDSIFEWTMTGDGFRNAPLPPGTTCSIRLLHAFQMRDGLICREHGYEIWRDINDTVRVNDDIPANARVTVFD